MSAIRLFRNFSILNMKLQEKVYKPAFYHCRKYSDKAESEEKLKEESRISKYFVTQLERDKTKFMDVIHTYKSKEKHLRGHVEFIQAALERMEEFGVHRDLEVYKELLDVFPKGKMIARNIFQVEFFHYPKQQLCAIEVLEQMTEFGVLPDSEVKAILMSSFAFTSHPMRVYASMMYWMPKFRHSSPWRIPEPLPDDSFELAMLAVKRMSSVDPATKVTAYHTNVLDDATDDTWIVSAQSPEQQELIKQLPKNQSIKVEGPFGLILRYQRVTYFILRAEPRAGPKKPTRQELDDISDLPILGLEPSNKIKIFETRSVHEQDDGIILSICATGSSSRNSLSSWIRFLQQENPHLADIPVLFTQHSPVGGIITYEKESEERKKETSPPPVD